MTRDREEGCGRRGLEIHSQKGGGAIQRQDRGVCECLNESTRARMSLCVQIECLNDVFTITQTLLTLFFPFESVCGCTRETRKEIERRSAGRCRKETKVAHTNLPFSLRSLAVCVCGKTANFTTTMAKLLFAHTLNVFVSLFVFVTVSVMALRE